MKRANLYHQCRNPTPMLDEILLNITIQLLQFNWDTNYQKYMVKTIACKARV